MVDAWPADVARWFRVGKAWDAHGMAGQAKLEAARSIRRSLRTLSKEAEKAELDFIAYILAMAIMELDDVIAAAAERK
jgi:hypothetical protein